MQKVNNKKVLNIIFIGLLVTVLSLYAIIIISMFIWAGITSLKSSIAYSISSYGLPEKWTFDNYSIAFNDLVIPVSATRSVNVMNMILYSVIYTVGGALLSTLVPCFVAYTKPIDL